MTEKRQCKGTTKKGKRCTNPPLSDGDFCMAHLDKDEKERRGFGGAQKGSGPKPKPTIPGLMRQAVEDHVIAILTPHFRTLGYEPKLIDERIALEPLEGGGAKLFGESRDGVIKVSANDDLGAQMKAADQLIDRVYGRPKQTTELAGEIQGGGDTIFVVPEDDDWHRKVLAKVTEAEAAKVGSTNGGDPGSNGDGHQ